MHPLKKKNLGGERKRKKEKEKELESPVTHQDNLALNITLIYAMAIKRKQCCAIWPHIALLLTNQKMKRGITSIHVYLQFFDLFRLVNERKLILVKSISPHYFYSLVPSPYFIFAFVGPGLQWKLQSWLSPWRCLLSSHLIPESGRDQVSIKTDPTLFQQYTFFLWLLYSLLHKTFCAPPPPPLPPHTQHSVITPFLTIVIFNSRKSHVSAPKVEALAGISEHSFKLLSQLRNLILSGINRHHCLCFSSSEGDGRCGSSVVARSCMERKDFSECCGMDNYMLNYQEP